MRKNAPTLEWHMSESDAEWERLQTQLPAALAPATIRRQQRKRTLWCMATILLLLAVGGVGWRLETNANRQLAETALRASVQQKIAVNAASGSALLPAPAMTGQTNAAGKLPDSGWVYQDRSGGVWPDDLATVLDVTLQKVELLDDQAIADVVMRDQSGKTRYRQTRFYQRTATGWLQIPPDASLWGAEITLETPYFVYHFGQNDKELIQTVAPQMDALYTTLWQNFALAILPTPEKFVIDVHIDQPIGPFSQFDSEQHLSVASPAIYLAPVDLTDADLLAQSLALPLIDYSLAQASERHLIGKAWQPLLKGISLWQLWNLDLPLAAWQEEIITWLYRGSSIAAPGQANALPEHYAALCTTYKLWLSAPLQLDIPLLCAEQDWNGWFSAGAASRETLLHLNQITQALSTNELVGPASFNYIPHPGQTVALATLIDYAVATYGRERLPALVAALGQHEHLETLIPAVYRVSAAEFEASWRTYLAANYGVATQP